MDRSLSSIRIDLNNLEHNLEILQSQVGKRSLWPVIKANAYGHDANIVGHHLTKLGYETLCVALPSEAITAIRNGMKAKFLVLSATLPDDAEEIVAHDLIPVVCTFEMLDALDQEAKDAGKIIKAHLKVDTGMGRVGVQPHEVHSFLKQCETKKHVRVSGLMSHFARADESDKTPSNDAIRIFRGVVRATANAGIDHYHMANSAGIFDLPTSYFDAVRPGISIYGLQPSGEIANARSKDLKPVLEWTTRITFLKETPSDTGLSYGHTYTTNQETLVATIPVGYGDGLPRRLSNKMDVLVGGQRCRQIGRITMDQSLVDVSLLRNRVGVGDEVVLIGSQGDAEISADEWASKSETINYEIVTGISSRVPRIVKIASLDDGGA